MDLEKPVPVVPEDNVFTRRKSDWETFSGGNNTSDRHQEKPDRDQDFGTSVPPFQKQSFTRKNSDLEAFPGGSSGKNHPEPFEQRPVDDRGFDRSVPPFQRQSFTRNNSDMGTFPGSSGRNNCESFNQRQLDEQAFGSQSNSFNDHNDRYRDQYESQNFQRGRGFVRGFGNRFQNPERQKPMSEIPPVMPELSVRGRGAGRPFGNQHGGSNFRGNMGGKNINRLPNQTDWNEFPMNEEDGYDQRQHFTEGNFRGRSDGPNRVFGRGRGGHNRGHNSWNNSEKIVNSLKAAFNRNKAINSWYSG